MLSIAALSPGNCPQIHRPYLKRAFIQMAAPPAGWVGSNKKKAPSGQAIIKPAVVCIKIRPYWFPVRPIPEHFLLRAGLYALYRSQGIAFYLAVRSDRPFLSILGNRK